MTKGLDIEKLLKLNRLRDLRDGIKYVEVDSFKYVNGKRIPVKVKKMTDYGYVKDPGIIDEMFRMMYIVPKMYVTDEETGVKELCPAILDNYKGKRRTLIGHYAKRVVLRKDDRNHPFDNLFIGVETIVKKQIFGDDYYKKGWEMHNAEDWEQEARLMLLEELIKLSENKVKKFEIKDIEDFKDILRDPLLAEHVKAYIYRSIKSRIMKKCYGEGKHSSANKDFYYVREQKDGVREIKRVYNKYFQLDKPVGVDEDSSPYDVLDFQQENPQEELFKTKDATNIYRYILENRDIFTKKQNEYLDFVLSGNDKRNYKADYKFCYHRTEQNIIKKAMDKLNEDNNVEVNNKIQIKNIDFIRLVESLVDADDNLSRLELISNSLEDSTPLSDLVSDLIYSLDINVYKPIVSYINTKQIDDTYMSNEFNIVINTLIKEYNFQVKNEKLRIDSALTELSKEDKLVKYIEKNLFIDSKVEHGFIAKSSNDKGLKTLEDIRVYINELFNIDVAKKEVKFKLAEVGYLFDSNVRTTKNKTNCYKIFRI